MVLQVKFGRSSFVYLTKRNTWVCAQKILTVFGLCQGMVAIEVGINYSLQRLTDGNLREPRNGSPVSFESLFKQGNMYSTLHIQQTAQYWLQQYSVIASTSRNTPVMWQVDQSCCVYKLYQFCWLDVYMGCMITIWAIIQSIWDRQRISSIIMYNSPVHHSSLLPLFSFITDLLDSSDTFHGWCVPS